MISTKSIECVNVERYAYLFSCIHYANYNECIGRFFEQENDAGERQYVYEIYNDKIPDELVDRIMLPGMDLTQRHDVYVRSREIPCFVEYSVPPLCRPKWNIDMFLNFMQMDHYDAFEYMLRSRAITFHTNCYLGANENDFIDAWRVRQDNDFRNASLPNLNKEPYNEYHRAEPLFKEVSYASEIYKGLQ